MSKPALSTVPSVVAYGLEMTTNLLGTGRYLAIGLEAVFTFLSQASVHHKLQIVSGPNGMLTLKK